MELESEGESQSKESVAHRHKGPSTTGRVPQIASCCKYIIWFLFCCHFVLLSPMERHLANPKYEHIRRAVSRRVFFSKWRTPAVRTSPPDQMAGGPVFCTHKVEKILSPTSGHNVLKNEKKIPTQTFICANWKPNPTPGRPKHIPP